MLERMPYTDLDDPDYIQLNRYSELDALFELYGHLRAANPANQVDLRIADLLTPDEYTSHLVSLGGVDWNQATRSVIQGLALPVRQVADWTTASISRSRRTGVRSSTGRYLRKSAARRYSDMTLRSLPGQPIRSTRSERSPSATACTAEGLMPRCGP